MSAAQVAGLLARRAAPAARGRPSTPGWPAACAWPPARSATASRTRRPASAKPASISASRRARSASDELDPQEELPTGRVGRELLEVGDVGAVAEQVAGDRGRDPGPVGARRPAAGRDRGPSHRRQCPHLGAARLPRRGRMTEVAVLDDYQGRAAEFADWDRLERTTCLLRVRRRSPARLAALGDAPSRIRTCRR